MQKYQTFLQLMFEENKELFDQFSAIHAAYLLNPQINQAKFNEIGHDVINIIRDYERRLCGKTESGQYGKFSTGLSQKFWNEVRKLYPKIDFVGIN